MYNLNIHNIYMIYAPAPYTGGRQYTPSRKKKRKPFLPFTQGRDVSVALPTSYGKSLLVQVRYKGGSFVALLRRELDATADPRSHL